MLIHDKPKQILVFNRSLNMPAGKLAAQLSHASLGCVLKLFEKNTAYSIFSMKADFHTSSPEYEWLENEFTKIVCYVKSEEALLKVHANAEAAGLNTVLIKDAGHTFFDKPTYTCVGIGPAFDEDLKPVTGKLQLFKD